MQNPAFDAALASYMATVEKLQAAYERELLINKLQKEVIEKYAEAVALLGQRVKEQDAMIYSLRMDIFDMR
jgi:hypothetical protein